MKLLDLVKEANTIDNPYINPNVTPLYINSTLIGFIPPEIFKFCNNHPSVFSLSKINDVQRFNLCPGESTFEKRSDSLRSVFLEWRKYLLENLEKVGEISKLSQDLKPLIPLKGWRNEEYSVYDEDGNVILTVERAAAGLISVRTYGCHINGYVKDASAPCGVRMWVGRRSKTKQTYPGMLDNLVGGGLTHGYNPFDNMVKEAGEEASLDPEFVSKNLKSVGLITFYLADPSRGWIPDTEYLYDLEMPETMIPKPEDGEVEQFYLWSLDEIKERLENGEFSPESGLVVIEFFIRHGFITPTNEKDYEDIILLLHRKFPLCGPGKYITNTQS